MKYISLYRSPKNAGSTEKTKPAPGVQKISGGIRTLLKWNDSETFCFEGPRDVGVATGSVSVSGPAGKNLSFGVIVGKWVSGKWQEVRWLESISGEIPSDGVLKTQISVSNKLSKGERIYFYLHPEKSETPFQVN